MSLYNIKHSKEERKIVSQPVTRYRAGQKPEWAEDRSESEEDIFSGEDENDENKEEKPKRVKVTTEMIREAEKRDKRLERLSKLNSQDVSKRVQERLKLRREIHKSELVNKEGKEEKIAILGEGQTNRRREIMRNKIIDENKGDKKEEKDDELLELIGNEEENEPACVPDKGEQEVEEAEAEEEIQDELLMRPVFIFKEGRKTITKETPEEKKEKEMLEKERQVKIKKQQTKEILKKMSEEEQKAKENEKEINESEEMPDDTDDLDNLAEYEKWKLRELRRIKKQVEEDEKKLQELKDIERRRNLSEEQRQEENLRLGSDATLKPFKSKMNLYQKYYHTGAFFKDEAKFEMEHVFNRNYNLPTAEDKVDVSSLPKVLQKRRGMVFKKGQSKYTHLSAEDTTDFDPNFRVPENISNRIFTNFGGFKTQNTVDPLGRKRK